MLILYTCFFCWQVVNTISLSLKVESSGIIFFTAKKLTFDQYLPVLKKLQLNEFSVDVIAKDVILDRTEPEYLFYCSKLFVSG